MRFGKVKVLQEAALSLQRPHSHNGTIVSHEHQLIRQPRTTHKEI